MRRSNRYGKTVSCNLPVNSEAMRTATASPIETSHPFRNKYQIFQNSLLIEQRRCQRKKTCAFIGWNITLINIIKRLIIYAPSFRHSGPPSVRGYPAAKLWCAFHNRRFKYEKVYTISTFLHTTGPCSVINLGMCQLEAFSDHICGRFPIRLQSYGVEWLRGRLMRPACQVKKKRPHMGGYDETNGIQSDFLSTRSKMARFNFKEKVSGTWRRSRFLHKATVCFSVSRQT